MRENRVDIGLLDLLPRGFRGLNIGFLEVVPKKAAEERAFIFKPIEEKLLSLKTHRSKEELNILMLKSIPEKKIVLKIYFPLANS